MVRIIPISSIGLVLRSAFVRGEGRALARTRRLESQLLSQRRATAGEIVPVAIVRDGGANSRPSSG
jgi:hypothetical protein